MIKQEFEIEYEKKGKSKKALYGIMLVLPIIMILVGSICVNIINTKAMSPIGNTENNYEIASSNYGKDFEAFIKDNAQVKIYQGADTIVKVGNVVFRVKKEGFVITGFNYAVSETKNFFNYMYAKMTTTKETQPVKSKDEELNNKIDAFIENNNN